MAESVDREFLDRIQRQAALIEAMDRRELELLLSRIDGAQEGFLDGILERHARAMKAERAR